MNAGFMIQDFCENVCSIHRSDSLFLEHTPSTRRNNIADIQNSWRVANENIFWYSPLSSSRLDPKAAAVRLEAELIS